MSHPKSQSYNVGDLVKYIAFQYTPDFFYRDTEELEDTMGVIVAVVYHGDYIVEPWMYKVFWFATGRVTEAPTAHLRIISASSTQ